MFASPDGLVHVVIEAWDIVGERTPVEFSLHKMLKDPKGVLPLNLRFACLERGLWMKDPSNGTPTDDAPTCMACAVWRAP